MKILAIDDNRDNLTTIEALISERMPEATVMTAEDGASGIEIARAEDPDVVLLDIVMPDMDGFAVCEALKADETLRSVPVIFVTALRTDSESRRRALQVGAEGFLTKPLDDIELVAQVQAMAKVKMANRYQALKKSELAALVAERTFELEQELAERKRAEERHRTVLETTRDGYWLVDAQGRILEANSAYCEASGYSAEEILGMRVSDLEAVETSEETSAHIERVRTRGEERFESQHRRKDGTRFDVEISVTPLPDGSGRQAAFLRDITERKRVAEELRRTLRLLEEISDSSGSLIYALDADGHFVFTNKALEKVVGAEPGGLIGLTREAFLPQEVCAEHRANDLKAVESGESQTTEETNQGADGPHVYLSVKSPLRDSDGRVFGVIGVSTDITDQKRSEQDLRALLDNAPYGAHLYELDDDDRLVFIGANHKAEEILGLDHVPLFGKTLEEAFPGNAGTETAVAYQRVAAEGGTWETEQYAYDAEGITGVFEVYAFSFGPRRMAVFFRDITEKRKLQEELVQTSQALAQSLSSIVEIVSQVAETRDPYTAGHQQRVSELATFISQEMGMTPEQTEEIRIAALLHDIGKMSVPAEILSKPGALSPVEFELIKAHSEAGYRIISTARMTGDVAEIVYQHHERCDGSGYPRGLKVEELLPASKVLMVADVVEAMVSHRPYRAALGRDEALAEIELGSGTRYDPQVVASCLRCMTDKGFAFSEV